MLNDASVHATIPVRDLQVAQKFYETTLGLTRLEENPVGIVFGSGGTKVLVYQSEFAGTNQATTASWEVEDPDSVVRDLARGGLTFEHYDDLPGTTREGDIHVMGQLRAAWFKDPDGNILCIGSSL